MTVLTTRGLPAADLLIRRLSPLGPLSAADRALIASLPSQRRQHQAGDDLQEQGEALRSPRIIVAGWACRMRVLPDGRRQIFCFLLPGDGLGLCARPNPLALSTTVALTRVETVDASAIGAVMRASPPQHAGLKTALLVSASLEEAALLDHMVRLGRQTAYERTAHLLLELRQRLAAVGVAAERRFPLPLIQEVLADALGLSVVHVNRTLQQLRRDQLLVLRSGYAELPDPQRLAEVANYHPPEPTAAVAAVIGREAWVAARSA